MSAHAVAYLRTSSPANVGDGKDSGPRQRAAIEAGARRLGLDVVEWFYDAGVTGDRPVSDRPGFTAMLDRIDGNGVCTVIVESADRFARKMLTAELGILLLCSRGVTLLTAAGENLTDTDDRDAGCLQPDGDDLRPARKDPLGQEVEGGRDRKSDAAGRRIEGRKGTPGATPSSWRSPARCGRNPARHLGAASRAGYITANGKPFSAAQVKRLVDAE